jgi:hypothetical protein
MDAARDGSWYMTAVLGHDTGTMLVIRTGYFAATREL